METYLSSLGMSKVVIEDVSTQEGSLEFSRTKKKLQPGQSSNCKKRLMLKWIEPKESCCKTHPRRPST